MVLDSNYSDSIPFVPLYVHELFRNDASSMSPLVRPYVRKFLYLHTYDIIRKRMAAFAKIRNLIRIDFSVQTREIFSAGRGATNIC